MFNKHSWLILSISFLMVALVGCGNGTDNNNSTQESTNVSSENSNRPQAYNFTVEKLGGEQVSLSDYQGKVLIVNIWDTWCPPCRAEIPDFIKLYDEYNDDGLVILGIAAAQEGVDAVEKFVESYNINYPIALLNQQTFEGFGPIKGIPTTFVIDKNGRIAEKYVGLPRKAGLSPYEAFEQDVKALL
jgi:cytochrome c biogenesis protein CcmG/thiol:disulfide interchange protein DsbE